MRLAIPADAPTSVFATRASCDGALLDAMVSTRRALGTSVNGAAFMSRHWSTQLGERDAGSGELGAHHLTIVGVRLVEVLELPRDDEWGHAAAPDRADRR